VYQTCGEIFSSEQGNGQCVGKPFPGLGIRICREDRQESLVDVDPGADGEIVLYGSQLDKFSGYLKRSELDYKFVLDAQKGTRSERCVQHYRTGDRGTYDEPTGILRVGGRITGEEAMVKVNGVRVELGEIENSLIDEIDDGDQSNPVVLNCMAIVVPVSAEGTGSSERNEITAYCMLSDSARREVGISEMHNSAGFFVNGGPLATLLRARCAEKVKLACIPKAFVVIPRLPLSPTGKCDRNGLPKLESCSHLGNADQNSLLLNEYGVAGSKIAEVLTECLNLQPSQESILTTTATFAMVGGDSMASIRVTRALYAYHHKVANNRFLGGEFGKLTGPFDVVNLLRSENLGAYVQMLDSQNLCRPDGHEDHLEETNQAVDLKPVDSFTATTNQSDADNESQKSALYDAMFQATTLGQSSIAIGLLSVGADPNFGLHSGRLGKVTHRLQQRALFRSSPMHIACLRGDDRLVKKLLEKNSKFNSPDASGMFPIHLASSGTSEESKSADEDDINRLCCLQYLLQAGAPMAMRDGNKQSVLHCAARAGHCELLKYVMTTWKEKNGDGDDITPKHFFNSRDRWMRKLVLFSCEEVCVFTQLLNNVSLFAFVGTPVHWAVLNGQVGALEILLQMGCSATPFKPKVNNRSSAAVESPMEMCERLYDPTNGGKGAEIQLLLLSHTKAQTEGQKT
jgi:ankyrin repeat protein